MTLLELDEIHTYYGQSHVLQGVSLEIDRGEVVALLGRNGAGKTTTLRSIIGLTPPREGAIRFDGERVDGKDPYQIARAGIGYVPEERNIFPDLSVADNISVSLQDESEWSYSRLYDLFPWLEERKAQRGATLSGGEQQMLSIARALVTDPQLLVLDEPSEGLAPTIVEDVERILSDIIESDVTVLLTEQNLEFALGLAERSYVLNKGRVQWDGTVAELREDEELIGKYLTVSLAD